jgi:multisubunit Na+/H+ antiporter MnhB subunit
MMATLARLRLSETNKEAAAQPGRERLKAQSLQWLPSVILLLFTAGLGYAVLSLPSDSLGLSAQVAANLEITGVSNPVTAVLLNFRGYDTLLEMVVLLLALLGVWSLGCTASRREAKPGSVLDTLARLLVPVLILVAGYMLWVGAHAPGGAFQAGSVLGAAGVLLLLTGWRLNHRLAALPLRLSLVAGSGTFLVMAVLTLLSEGQVLKYPQEQAGTLILIIEAAATLSIGVTLAALFLGNRPSNNKDLK